MTAKKTKPIAIILVIAMIFTLAPSFVFAADTNDYTSIDPETISIDTSILDDTDDLADNYINRILYDVQDEEEETTANPDDGIATIADYGSTSLTGNALTLYDELKDFIEDIAANGGSTIYYFDCSYKSSSSDLYTAFYEALDAYEIETVLYTLMVDCPYDFYWFDKTVGLAVGGSLSSNSSGTYSVVQLILYFSVSDDYSNGDYYVDTDIASSVQIAKENAEAIVAEYADLDYADRLEAYKEEICALTDYNTEAVSSDDVSYGDPWQLIYVFDGDDSTDVVCEGYSKAFQYLCDLTWPDNDPVTCYTVTGYLEGGGHMWNLVTITGIEGSYLVDVTNSDSGTIGQSGGLFLTSANETKSSDETGYTIAFGSTTISFVYDSNTSALYTTDILTLSETSFSDIDASDCEHAYESVITQEATCTEDGVITYTCTACGDTYTETITAAGHSYDDGVVTTEATCTEDGVITYTCTVCGDTYTEVIAAAGHTYDDGVVTTEATCTEDGVITYTCTACGDTYTETISAAGHSYDGGVVTEEATCTEDGVITYTCSVCGDTYTETISAAGHSYDDGVVTTEATCTEDGVITYTCTACGDTYAETISAAGHSYDGGVVTTEATCTEGGVITYTCSVCGDAYTETISAAGHTYDDGVVTTEATCTEGGVITYTCSVCGNAYTETIPATGHSYVSEVTQEATCTEDGEITYTCTACDDTYTETVAATGHSYENGVCTKCGDVKETESALSKPIADTMVIMSGSTYIYDGTAKKPVLIVKSNMKTLIKGKDYTLSYSNNINVGTATVTITGIGAYSGSIIRNFSIKPQELKASNITLAAASVTYTGEALTPSVVVKDVSGKVLVKDMDYTVSYSNNKNAGTAIVTITGTGNYSGVVTKTFTITAAKNTSQANTKSGNTAQNIVSSVMQQVTNIINTVVSGLKK